MEPTQAYIFLLADSFMASLLLPIQNMLVLPVMKIFGGYNMPLAASIAAVGATIGALVNFAIGRLIRLSSRYSPKSERAKKFVDFLQNKAHILLLFSFVPVLGGVITTFIGIAKANLKKSLIIFALVNLVYNFAFVLISF